MAIMRSERARLVGIAGGVAAAAGLLAAGCVQVPSKYEVEPIYVQVDVNLRVERELDDFFGEIDKQAETLEYEETEEVAY